MIKYVNLFLITSFIAGNAGAVITGPAVVDFSNSGFPAYSGTANTPLLSLDNNTCGVKSAGCYVQNGIALGVVSDPSNSDNHFHLNSNGMSDGGITVGQSANIISDSNGLYFRAIDGTAFSLQSMIFSAKNTSSVAINPIYGANAVADNNGILQPDGSNVLGPNEYWQIFGFNSAVNPNLSTQDPKLSSSFSSLKSEYPDLVAYQTVSNGFNGTLNLNSAFSDVNAVWIHYYGYPETPSNGIAFRAYIDNIDVSNAVISLLPIPGGFWMFLSAIPLLVMRRRKCR